MNKEDGHIIRDNPLRILGVFSNTPRKEIVANLGKLRAFAKTGKIISFETDYTALLGPVNRSIDKIEKANNNISLPKDKLQAGIFWFMQHTENDKLALDCLKTGDTNKAMAIFQKKSNYSGVINMAVLALIIERWDIAIYSYAYLLESDLRRGALIKAFTDAEDLYSEEELADFISSKLIQDFPDAHWLDKLQIENIELGEKTRPFRSRFADSKLVNQLSNKCISQIHKGIDYVLNKASSCAKKDANANLKMAELVQEKSKYLLKELRQALGKEDKNYIDYADKVANQILDNCIDYYNNDSDNPNREKNVIKYIRFAFRTAESKISKERAKKNLDILNETIDNLMPESIEEEFNAIDKLVKNYHDINSKVDNTHRLSDIIDEAYQKILIIKDKVGKDNKHYISISTNFVYFAYQEIVKKINALSDYSSFAERKKYVSILQWAKSLFESLEKFDKDNECQTVFDRNFNSLKKLIRDNVVNPTTSKPKPLQSSPNPVDVFSDLFLTSISTPPGISIRKESKKKGLKERLFAICKVLPKYIVCLGILVLYVILCIFINIHWGYKVMCFLPTIALYWVCAKYLPPTNFDGPIVVTGKYTGGDFSDETPMFGKFSFRNKRRRFMGSPQVGVPYRTYVFKWFWIILLPAYCLALSIENEKTSYGMPTTYRVYGICKWCMLEVLFLYLYGITIITLVIDVFFTLALILNYINNIWPFLPDNVHIF